MMKFKELNIVSRQSKIVQMCVVLKIILTVNLYIYYI